MKSEIALFPLSGIILFPGAFLPLHIFEPRYRMMLNYCLENDSELAVTALLSNHSVETTFGWGKIVRHDPLPDGRSNILVEGMGVAHLEEFKSTEPFIIAGIEKLENIYSHMKTPEFKELTRELIELTKNYLRKLNVEEAYIAEIDKLVVHPFPVEFIASVLNCDYQKKQEILVTRNPYDKAIKLIELLNELPQ